jgi:hypothetical protein
MTRKGSRSIACRTTRTWLAAALCAGAGLLGPVRGQGNPGREIPAAFAPFEYLVGRWNGQAMPKDPKAQQFRGWSESHSWAWVFTRGQPTGLSVAIEGGKVLGAGKLTYDPDRKRYRLEGTEPKPGGGPLAFEGALDSSGKTLLLEQVGPEAGPTPPRARLRLSLRPNSNFIRYTLRVDRREPGAVQFSPAIEVGLTKEGETFAAGSTAAERPRCIVTGGAATLTLTYQGRTFPICCTGCRDEFHENPEKYLKKASSMAQSQAGKKSDQPAPARASRYEDAFSNDVVDAPATKATRPATGPTPKGRKADPAPGPAADAAKRSDRPGPGAAREKATALQPAVRAAGLLRIGQSLERSDKIAAALETYRRIVKDYPGTPAAKTSAERIKALQ